MERGNEPSAVLVVPGRIEPADELDRLADAAPRLIAQVGTDVTDLTLHLDLVAEVIETEHRDGAGVFRSHPEDQIEGRGLARAVRSDEAVDRAAGDREIQR